MEIAQLILIKELERGPEQILVQMKSLHDRHDFEPSPAKRKCHLCLGRQPREKALLSRTGPKEQGPVGLS